MFFQRSFLLSWSLLLLLAGCAAPVPPAPPAPTVTPAAVPVPPSQASEQVCPPCPSPPPPPPESEILDLLLLPQDIAFYLPAELANSAAPLWPEQEQHAADYLRRYFAPWEKKVPPAPPGAAYWIVAWLAGKEIFDYTGRPVAEGALQAAIARADAAGYPSLDRMAITVRATASRALPEHRPWFLDPKLAGEGLPFDYLQNSALPPHTPVRVHHRSRDGAWLFAETAAIHGWLPAEDVAFVDAKFIERFRQGALVTATDGLPVVDNAGVYRFQAGLGTFFPLVRNTPEGWRVLVAAATSDGRALWREARLKTEALVPFPLPATAANLATLGNRLLGQPYGWGGLYGDRDCSATLRDLFAPFGLWLPRNSGQQAGAGTRISLTGLSAAEKQSAILASGLPLRTLLWLKGHVLLYLGEHLGQPVALHTFWGVRTRDAQGKEGRKVVGRTVITTLQPGIEREDLALPEGDLLTRIGSMTILGDRLTPEAAAQPIRQ